MTDPNSAIPDHVKPAWARYETWRVERYEKAQARTHTDFGCATVAAHDCSPRACWCRCSCCSSSVLSFVLQPCSSCPSSSDSRAC